MSFTDTTYAPIYRIGNSDRIVGGSTNIADGFIVLNLSNGQAFVTASGVWAQYSETLPDVIVTTWSLTYSIPTIPVAPSTAFTYYIDPTNGNDGNTGSTYNNAWATTASADALILTGAQNIGYLSSGVWYLYRALNMTADEAQLAANLVGSTADSF